eukprot:2680364-Rhodomonas_salina.1
MDSPRCPATHVHCRTMCRLRRQPAAALNTEQGRISAVEAQRLDTSTSRRDTAARKCWRSRESRVSCSFSSSDTRMPAAAFGGAESWKHGPSSWTCCSDMTRTALRRACNRRRTVGGDCTEPLLYLASTWPHTSVVSPAVGDQMGKAGRVAFGVVA